MKNHLQKMKKCQKLSINEKIKNNKWKKWQLNTCNLDMTLIPSTFRKLSSLSTGKKLTSSPKFLEIGDITNLCKLLILGTLGMPGYAHESINLQKTSCLSACQKSTSLSTFFLT